MDEEGGWDIVPSVRVESGFIVFDTTHFSHIYPTKVKFDHYTAEQKLFLYRHGKMSRGSTFLLVQVKEIFEQLNIVAQCKKYNVALWQCPQFLFLIMGIIIIISALSAYLFGNRYIQDPLIVSLITLILTAVLFSVAVIVTRSFERLAEANKMKSEFITIATHQLRSPLSNLRWSVELLLSGKLGIIEKKQLEYFAILKENINRMQESVSDLLAVSRIEAAKVLIKKKFFSLRELTENVISEYQPFAKASNVKINLNVEKNLPKILSDPLHVELVVNNLLENAVRYIQDRGKVEINILKKGKNIYFSITDNGVGIPKEEQKYVFQKFFRSKKITKHQTHGSGLGLYMSKATLTGLKGKIGFKSKENQGSTFWFTLPIQS